MLTNIKALLVVLVIAGLVFHLVKPLCLRFMAEEDFVRRRLVWMLLNGFAFTSPNFWIFVLFAGPLLFWAQRKDPNPAALFLLAITTAPPVTLAIPTVGIGALFDLSLPRLLSLTVLLPAVLAHAADKDKTRPKAIVLIDYCIAAFVLVQLVVLLPYDSFTNILRRGLHFVLDFALIYYAFSRVLIKQASIYEAAAAFCLACAIAAPLAAFETARSWLLYQGIGEVWGNPDPFAWLFRGSLLRAQVSAGHSLTFGYHMAIGFGLTMVLLRPLHSKRLSLTAAAWMWVGLLAAYSRAPWLAAGLFAVVSAVLLPGAASNLKRLIFVVAAGSALVLMSPYGDAVIDNLPFIGSVDAENVTYRQQLAATSWNLIWRSPWFGDPLVLRDMEHLRQGQGIIDLVNSYASVTLFNGFVGLATFVGPMLIACWVAYSTMKKTEKMSDLDSSLGAGLIAAMAATLFFIATSNIPWLIFAILGMLVAYIQLDRRAVAVITPVENKAAVRPFANAARPGSPAYRGSTRRLR